MDLQLRIEQFWLEDQTRIHEGLEGQPTSDQLLMGMFDDVTRPLTYDELYYICKGMVIRLKELSDQPKILYKAAYERFAHFVFVHCEAEMLILLKNQMRNLDVIECETPTALLISEKIKEFISDNFEPIDLK